MNEQNNNVSFFRKNRYIVSIVFALIISGVVVFLAFPYLNSIGNGFSPIPGLIFYFLLFVSFALSRSLIYKNLVPITTEEIAQSEITNINSKKFLKWFLIIIIIIAFSFIFMNYYNNFKK